MVVYKRIAPVFISLMMVLFLPLFVIVTPASASDASRIEALEHKVEELEHGSSGGGHGSSFWRSITEHVTLGGVVELEAFYEDNDNLDENDQKQDHSDIELSVDILLEAELNEHVSAEVLLILDDGVVIVDDAIIVLTHPVGPAELSFTGGLTCVPFGAFNSGMITDPLTLDLGETCETLAMLTVGAGPVEVSGGAYNGHMEESGLDRFSEDRIEDFFAALTVEPIEGVAFGGYYLSNFAGTEGLSESIYEFNGHNHTVLDVVAGFGGFLSVNVGPVRFDGEWLGAAEGFHVMDLDLDGDGKGDRPEAYSVEIAVKPHERVEVIARWDGTVDAYDLPENTYGGTVAVELYENVGLAVEYLMSESHMEDEDDIQTATANLGVEF